MTQYPLSGNRQAGAGEGDEIALIALGGNVTSPEFGPPEDALREALSRLGSESVRLVAASRLYRTPAFPAGSGPDYVNAAAAVRTTLGPAALLAHLHAIERAMGRVRRTRWAARTLDLDLLAMGDRVLPDAATLGRWMDLPVEAQRTAAPSGLVLPHPRMHERAFVLVPLADVAPDWRHPVLGLTVAEMVRRLPAGDRKAIRPLSA